MGGRLILIEQRIIRRANRRSASAALSAGLLCLGVMAIALPAHAAGLYFSERGVRPLGRGGAFTAGADDLGAIWYNPAGIYDAGSQLLFDASWLHFTNDYTRSSIVKQRDPNTGEVVSSHRQTFPTVTGSSPVIPIPTLAASYTVHPDVVLALGIEAPYAAIASYPEKINGEPSPQRYSLITMEGSALAVLGFWGAWAINRDWHVGAGVQMLMGKFVTTTMQSSCVPEKFFCAPEQPEWDTLSQLTAGPIIAPSGNIGVKWAPHRKWRVGAAFQAPFFIRSSASVAARLPATPAFETASQEGEEADVSFELPYSVRLGVQFEPLDRLFVELDVAFEGWSMHDEITVEPQGIALRNVVGFPDPYYLPDQHIPRNFQDTFSLRLGGEYDIKASNDYTVTPRLGLSYESSAVPPEFLSVLTVDMPKVTLGMGLSIHVDAWRFDVVYAHLFALPVEVAPEHARMPLLVPVDANIEEPHYVNGGTYDASANVLGLGLRYAFDHVSSNEPQDDKKEAQRR